MNRDNGIERAASNQPEPDRLEWAVLLKASHGNGKRPPIHDTNTTPFSRLTTLGSFGKEIEMELVDTDRRLRISPDFSDVGPEIVRLQDAGLIAKDPDDFWHATPAGEERLEALGKKIWPRLPTDLPYDT